MLSSKHRDKVGLVDLSRRSEEMPTSIEKFSSALRANADEFCIHLHETDIQRLSNYYALLLKWTSQLHLVAPCSPEEFATRHLLESLMLLRHLSPDACVVDVGSGAGLPIIPCLIMRADLRATLIESSQSKGVFLREALRGLPNGDAALVITARFEETSAPDADFVTCRAVDRFQQVLPTLIDWAPPASTLLLFAGASLRTKVETLLPSAKAERIPKSQKRFLVVVNRPTHPDANSD